MEITEDELMRLKELLSEFKDLDPIPEYMPTIFEISGYPHYEDVISNILQFFLRSDYEHGFSSIFVESLLDAVNGLENQELPSDFMVLNVDREVTTKKNNRIDIVIETENQCIAIENKIYHHLQHNDLQDYQEYIKENNPEKDNVFLVLSLQSKQKPDNWGKLDFEEVLYDDFFNNIERQMKKVSPHEERIQIYLADFMKTIRNLNKGTELTMEFLEYLQKNKSEIETLHRHAFVYFKNEIKAKGDRVKENVKFEKYGFDSFHLNKPHSLEYVQGFKKVISVGNSSFELQIKVRLQPKKYSIELWVGDESQMGAFDNFMQSRVEKYSTLESHPENHAGKIYWDETVTEDRNPVSEIIEKVNGLMQKF